MRELTAKKILTRRNSLSIYRGCTHRCICCRNRSRCSGVKDFTNVGVRVNAPEVLAADLRAKRRKCIVSFSSLSDPYQPLELETGLTRECLGVLRDMGFGANVLTKSESVLRDMDLLEEINFNTKAVFQTCLSAADDGLCKALEPGACPTSRRLELIKEMKGVGLPVIVRLEPIIPFITDSEENLGELIDMALSLNVDGIYARGFGVVLKNTSREYFLEQLDKRFPELMGSYLGHFDPQFALESPNAESLKEVFLKRTAGRNVMTDPMVIQSFARKYQCREQGQQVSFF